MLVTTCTSILISHFSPHDPRLSKPPTITPKQPIKQSMNVPSCDFRRYG
jgi:hypothetical protein